MPLHDPPSKATPSQDISNDSVLPETSSNHSKSPHQEEPILRLSRNITVRRCRPSDAASMAHHVNNPNVVRHMSDRYKAPFTLERAASRIAQMYDPAEAAPAGKGRPDASGSGEIRWDGPPTLTDYAIAVDDVCVGVVALKFGTTVNKRTANFAYWIGEEYWGRGIVTEVTSAFMRWAWETFDDLLMRLEAKASSDNSASHRVLEKLGFKYVGRLEDAIWKDDQLLDVDLYGMTRNQWLHGITTQS